MPAKSRNQLIAMQIAAHNPDKLYARNKGLAKMSKSQLGDFTHTSMKGLPVSKGSGDMHSPQRVRRREMSAGDHY